MSDTHRTDHSTAAMAEGPWVTPDALAIVVLSGDAKGSAVRLPPTPGPAIRIGQAPDNDLVVPDRTVSRYHLTISRESAGVMVKDTESRNGVVIGGARVREAVLEPGAILQIGDTTLQLRIDPKGALVPPSDEDRFGIALGGSMAMRRIFGMLERIAATDATVLLTGETGTGKDVLARSVHLKSKRSKGPFEVVDCGAISPTLIESELFGHEKGAFTGAVNAYEGAFERAKGGTIFLDELGELSIDLQPKLLRVLEARQVRRVGGKKPIDIDVRVVAATTRDLQAEVRAARFRQDLYFRLAVVPLEVPPLRARLEDIPLLADAILRKVSTAMTSPPLAPEAVAALRSHDWPGNVRELRNVLERAAYLAEASGEDAIRQLPIDLNRMLAAPAASEGDAFAFAEGTTYRDARARVEAEFERRFVDWALAQSGGNIAAAARTTKMDRKHLGDLVRRHRSSGSSG